MKKFFLSAIMMLGLFTTSVMAENNNVDKVSMYTFNINKKSLSSTLGLSKDQDEMMSDIMDMFYRGMLEVSNGYSDETSRKMVRNVISTNLGNVKQILDKEQYKKYLVLLNTTLHNRGIAF